MVDWSLSFNLSPSRGLLVLFLLHFAVHRCSACVDALAVFDDHMSVHVDPRRNGSFRIPCQPMVIGQFNLKTVSWRFNGSSVTPSSALQRGSQRTKRLVYRRFEESRHAGWYQCRLHYQQGVLVSPTFQVARNSLSQPRLLLSHGAPRLPTSGSALVVLECRVDRVWPDSLLPTFVWYREDRRLSLKRRRDIQMLPCDRPPSAAANCLYLWSAVMSPATAAKFRCGAVLGRNHRNSSAVRVGPGAVVSRVFPEASTVVRREVRDVYEDSRVALTCARRGVVTLNQTRWALEGSAEQERELMKALDLEVGSEQRRFLLGLQQHTLAVGSKFNLSCASAAKPNRVLRKLSVRVFPRQWHVWQCSKTLIVRAPGSRIHLRCKPTTENQFPRRACELPIGSLTRDMDMDLPDYTVDWFFNGELLRPRDDKFVVNRTDLYVNNVTDDFPKGIFQCRVRTPLGDQRWATYVVLVRKPEKPKWESVTVTKVDQTSASVSVRLSGKSPICGELECRLFNESPQSIEGVRSVRPSFEHVFRFNHLWPYKNYSGECKFLRLQSGGIQRLSHSPKFRFTTLEGRPTAQPDFQVVEERPGALLIRWTILHKSHAMGQLTRHKVMWRLASNTDEYNESVDLPVNQTQFLLTGLLGNALYEVAVESGTRVGYPELLLHGRRRLTMRGLTMPVHSRGYFPRLYLIQNVVGFGVSTNLSLSWNVTRRQLVHQWNVTVHFSLASPRPSFILPGTADSALVPAPGPEQEALVWLEAQDSQGRVVDDWVGVVTLYHYPSFEVGRAAPMRAPTNVSVTNVPGEASLEVRWSSAGRGSLCVSIGLHACYVRVRLIPLPKSVHRVRLYTSLSPYLNASEVAAGRLTLSGLLPGTKYSVGVAFVRPPLSSPFAPREGNYCVVRKPVLPVPTVQLRRVDDRTVYVWVHAQHTEAVRYVAFRWCSADARPLPGETQFEPTKAATRGVELRLRTGSASFLQAACCYEQNRCAAWSPAVALDSAGAIPVTDRPWSSPELSPWQVAGLGLLLLSLAATAVALVLAVRMRRLRAELRRRPTDVAASSHQPEAQPFV